MLSLTKMYRPITAQPFDRSDGYREISPCEALKPYIRCFWTYESSPDMQPQLVTFLSTVNGTSTAREGVWDDRFRYVAELIRMGANINVEGKLAIINGVDKLMGTSVRATDLRAGAAMIIAGLMADGVTEIHDIYHIDRGYENFEDKFIKLGGDIKRVQVV